MPPQLRHIDIPKVNIDRLAGIANLPRFKEGLLMPQLAVYFEHPDWFRPVFAALERRGVPYVKIDAGAHIFDLDERKPPYDLVFNRASPSGYLRGHLGTIFSTWSWLSHLERLGVPVVNGSRVFSHEISKARQLTALQELGIAYPRARAINNPSVAVAASKGLRFPIVVKANVGGSGAGIVRFDPEAELAPGEEIDLAIAIDRVHCFDADGRRIDRVALAVPSEPSSRVRKCRSRILSCRPTQTRSPTTNANTWRSCAPRWVRRRWPCRPST